MRFFFGKGE
ncbi:Protein of unknown function [Bacillus cereus]|nr:Protein of unknown function [Bacillus cereus]SCM11121.1 Protein of unknown function [Bacillus wiedmannii]SCN01751.1 Protein of unknown function [Bacillus cereus]SCN40743.1 Protein of unknown function [Bacillus wiedmannii]